MTKPSTVSIVVLVSLMLGACAAAVPGFVPASNKAASSDRIKAFASGDVAGSGVYEPSAAEKALECRKLNGSMQVIMARLRDSDNRPAVSAATKQLEIAATGVTGKPQHMDIDVEHRREASRLKAYNGLLAEKKCATIDLAKQGLPAWVIGGG